MSGRFRMPRERGEAEFVERRSRFVGRCAPVATEGEALDFLREVRELCRDASHNVYAWKVREGGLCRHSDDGEPSGTAGMPLLDVFLKREITNFCAVATRYFGGVLLGAGGLTRAYARTGVLALEAAGVREVRPWTAGRVALPYPLYDLTLKELQKMGAARVEPLFGAQVKLSFELPEELFDSFAARLTDLTAGRAAVERLETASR